MKRYPIFALLLCLALATSAVAGDRVPGDEWMAFADPGEAGFDAEKLAAAKATWDSLGECQKAMGKYDEAIASYQKALELDPDNPVAQDMIDEMRAAGK